MEKKTVANNTRSLEGKLFNLLITMLVAYVDEIRQLGEYRIIGEDIIQSLD